MNTNHFIKSRADKARLFTLSKQHIDLLLIAQTGLITNKQLYNTKKHGRTPESARLALTRLEKKELISNLNNPKENQTKYYALTNTGKKYIQSFFTEDTLKTLQIDTSKHLPKGKQQLHHRMLSNDFYMHYLSYDNAKLCPWENESPLHCHSTETPPRSDGKLSSPFCEYWIEQDNNTQSLSILKNKIRNYENAGFFSEINHKTLIFTCFFKASVPSETYHSFTHYRTLLHLERVWRQYEHETMQKIGYQDLYNIILQSNLLIQFHNYEIAILDFFSKNQKLKDQDSLKHLKTHYLQNKDEEVLEDNLLDQCFQKRYKSHFSKLLENHHSLRSYALLGNSIFALPNHRLHTIQPYSMPKEPFFAPMLLFQLLCNGLNTDDWEFFAPLQVKFDHNVICYFACGFKHPFYGSIAFELLDMDLTSRIRLEHYHSLEYSNSNKLILILLGSPYINPDTMRFYQEYFEQYQNVLYTKELFTPSSPQIALFSCYHANSTVTFECDAFDETLNLILTEEY